MEMNVKNPLISIIIPTYNQAVYIERTIQSVLMQDYNNFEIIIADDCSNDNTSQICYFYKKVDDRIKYFRNDQNLGRVKNYHKALYDYSNGDYVIYLDGDDYFVSSEFISLFVEILNKEKRNHPSIIMGCQRIDSPKGSRIVKHKISSEYVLLSGMSYVLGYKKYYQFSHLATLYDRKKAIEKDFYSLNIISSDIDSIFRLAIEGNVIVTNVVVGVWNYTGVNESAEFNYQKSIDNLIWISRVKNQLKSKRHKQYALWEIRMKYFLATSIIKSIVKKKKITLKEIYGLFKERIFFILILKLLEALLKKLKSREKKA